MTCNDDPHEGDKRLDGQVRISDIARRFNNNFRSQVRRKATDLRETNIVLDIVPVLKEEGATFNYDIIYRYVEKHRLGGV